MDKKSKYLTAEDFAQLSDENQLRLAMLMKCAMISRPAVKGFFIGAGMQATATALYFANQEWLHLPWLAFTVITMIIGVVASKLLTLMVRRETSSTVRVRAEALDL